MTVRHYKDDCKKDWKWLQSILVSYCKKFIDCKKLIVRDDCKRQLGEIEEMIDDVGELVDAPD